MRRRDGEGANSTADSRLAVGSRVPVSFERHQPLYERVPTRDSDGHPLSDFMMLIPGLRDRPGHQFKEILARIQAILAQFREVVFVDLNVPLNLLWVSVRAKPGIILDIACSVKFQVPEALLVAHKNTP
jgi:hypothetical protein